MCVILRSQKGAGRPGPCKAHDILPLQLVHETRLEVIALQLSGSLVDITRSAGDFVNDSGNKVVYDFTLLKVFTGLDVVAVRLPSGTRVEDLPFSKGDDVHLEVTVPPQAKIIYSGVVAQKLTAVAKTQ